MSTSLFGIGASVNVNVAGTLVPQSFTGSAGQTLFTITAFSYTPGTNSLLVFINGQKQIVGKDFAETSSISFTLVEGVIVGDIVEIIGFPLIVLTAVPATASIFLLPGAGAVQRSVAFKLSDMISVADFGAQGLGAFGVDETVDLQAAIAYTSILGKKLFWPTPIANGVTPGYYRTSAPLSVINVCSWTGENAQQTILRNKVGPSTTVALNGGDGTGPFEFMNMRIGGGGCVGIGLAAGGYAAYINKLTLTRMFFESDLLTGVNGNLIFFSQIDTWYGTTLETGVNANFRALVSSFSGARATNMNYVKGGGAYNSPVEAVNLSSGLSWNFKEFDWEGNVQNLIAQNVSDLVLESCYSERGTPPAFKGMYAFISNTSRARVLGGFHSMSVAQSNSAIFQASTDATLLVEDVNLSVPANGFIYFNSNTLTNNPPNTGTHNIRNFSVGALNTSDPLYWKNTVLDGAPQQWVPAPVSGTVVGTVTWTGTWTILNNRSVMITIRQGGTGTFAATAATYFPLPAQFVPAAPAAGSIFNENTQLAIGTCLAYLNGRLFTGSFAAQNGVDLSITLNY